MQFGRQIFISFQCTDHLSDEAISSALAPLVVQLFTDQSGNGWRQDPDHRQQQQIIIVLLSAWPDLINPVQYSLLNVSLDKWLVHAYAMSTRLNS